MRRPKKIEVRFFQNEAGTEPVRNWLKKLSPEDRSAIGHTIKDVEFGWPVGMPTVESITGCPGLWEVRVNLKKGIARVFFTISEGYLVLLHGIIKKTQKTPKAALELAKKRMKNFG
jgi:phage-related protein